MLNFNSEVEKPLDNSINGFTIYQDKSVPNDNQSNLKENNACPLKVIQNLKGFRIGHINIASLTKYVDQLQIYLQKESFDILSVNETRLDEHIIDSIVNINGYSIVKKDRNRDRGGVAIYYRNCTNIALRNDLIPEGLEAICIEVMQAKSKPILITSIYRPPNTSTDIFDKIEILMQNLDQENKEVIILGDFNCDVLSLIISNHTRKFLDLIEVFQFDQTITQPTRITQNSETLIDVALTNCAENIKFWCVTCRNKQPFSYLYLSKNFFC